MFISNEKVCVNVCRLVNISVWGCIIIIIMCSLLLCFICVSHLGEERRLTPFTKAAVAYSVHRMETAHAVIFKGLRSAPSAVASWKPHRWWYFITVNKGHPSAGESQHVELEWGGKKKHTCLVRYAHQHQQQHQQPRCLWDVCCACWYTVRWAGEITYTSFTLAPLSIFAVEIEFCYFSPSVRTDLHYCFSPSLRALQCHHLSYSSLM